MKIETLDPDAAEVLELIEASNRYYTDLYPPESNHLTSHEELKNENTIFIGGRIDTQLAVSAAAKIMNDDGLYAEIKRVFVIDEYRGRGLSVTIMNALEAAILEQGVTVFRLETGVKQPEAIGLYKKLGYQERAPFGAYSLDPLSVFMEKGNQL